MEVDYITILWWVLPYIDMSQLWVYMCPLAPNLPSTSLPIPSLSCPSTPALSALFNASISHMVIYMFQCYSVISSHPCLLPQSPKVCPLHLCLFCCLAYRVVVNIFLNSIYAHQYTVVVFFFLTYFTPFCFNSRDSWLRNGCH